MSEISIQVECGFDDPEMRDAIKYSLEYFYDEDDNKGHSIINSLRLEEDWDLDYYVTINLAGR